MTMLQEKTERLIRYVTAAGVVVALGLTAPAGTQGQTDAEAWVAAAFRGQPAPAAGPDQLRLIAGDPDLPPFSFTYGSRPSAEILKDCKVERSLRKIAETRTEYTSIYTHPSGLLVRCVGVSYSDFPTVEWTLSFKNTGSSDSPIIENIRSLDVHLARPGAGARSDANEYVLHYTRGTMIIDYDINRGYLIDERASRHDFEPLSKALCPGKRMDFAPGDGRPSGIWFPYFNVEVPGEGGGGIILAIGWPGQWSASFVRDGKTGLRITGGQELTHFKLHPGEEVRTPQIVMQFYRGNRIDSQNVWRRWMIAHVIPKPWTSLKPALAVCTWNVFGLGTPAHNAENEKTFIDRYVQRNMAPGVWWIDAGWFPCNGNWGNMGTWEVDRTRFPNGLKEVFDHARSKGIKKSVLWFDPQGVMSHKGCWIKENHPDWVLKAPVGGDWCNVFDFGNPEAKAWMLQCIDDIISTEGVDIYREDFNQMPLGAWRSNDAGDRQGITEIRFIEGNLAVWDELRRRHPNLLIDTCASGAHRDDIETLRRSVPLWRSDCPYGGDVAQCLTYGLSSWIPYYGNAVASGDPYEFRSKMTPFNVMGYDMRKEDLPYDLIRRLLKQREELVGYFLGDYYPLTSYSLENDVVMGWQFDRPEQGDGMVQFFRRADCPVNSAHFKLKALDVNANYTMTDIDTEKPFVISGNDLAQKGLPVEFTYPNEARIWTYKKQP